MPGLVPGIHVFLSGPSKDVDGRDEPGHDVEADGHKTSIHMRSRCGPAEG